MRSYVEDHHQNNAIAELGLPQAPLVPEEALNGLLGSFMSVFVLAEFGKVKCKPLNRSWRSYRE